MAHLAMRPSSFPVFHAGQPYGRRENAVIYTTIQPANGAIEAAMKNIGKPAFPLALLVLLGSPPAYAGIGASLANSPSRFVFPFFLITVISLGFALIRPICALTAYPLFGGVIGYVAIGDGFADLRSAAAEIFPTDNPMNWVMLGVAIAIPLLVYALMSSIEWLGDWIKQHIARRRAAGGS